MYVRLSPACIAWCILRQGSASAFLPKYESSRRRSISAARENTFYQQPRLVLALGGLAVLAGLSLWKLTPMSVLKYLS